MEMQLESKIYTVVESILSDKVLKILEPYAKLLPNDKSSYDVWAAESTNNNTAPECFTCDVLGKDRLEIVEELYNNDRLPCYQKKWLRNCDIAVQKLPVGGFIPKHTDHCVFSLTVFLSNVSGGEFVWWDNEVVHIVTPSVNTGVIACYNTYIRGASHEVKEVKEGVRYTMQLFVFDKKDRTTDNKSVVWDLEDK